MYKTVLYSIAITAGPFLTAQSPAFAQMPAGPPPVIRIIREDVKVGRGSAHEKNEAAYARALAKAGFPNYIGLNCISGPSEAWFIEGYPSYEGVGTARALTEKEPAKTELEQLDLREAESVSGSRNLMATYQKDLSFMPERFGSGKIHFVTVQMVRVRMGRDADYGKIRAAANTAGAAAGRTGYQIVYRAASGAPNGTYIVIRALESLKDLDPNPAIRPLGDVMGADRFAEFQKMLGDAEISSETMVFAVSPAKRGGRSRPGLLESQKGRSEEDRQLTQAKAEHHLESESPCRRGLSSLADIPGSRSTPASLPR